ncbi:putative Light-regulated protein precursor [Capsicum annuum]|nr:putative Light-regulated protein precursor [Capsicum annuum]
MMEKFLPVGGFDFFSDSDSILLLSGPSSSGKTSLVFQFAINSATANGERNVVFICNRRKLEAKPPYLPQGIDPSSDVIRRIHMKYIDDEEGIKKYFAAFHMHDPAPASVVIDDFADFFDQGNCQERYNNTRGRDLAMVGILALCRNAILYANCVAFYAPLVLPSLKYLILHMEGDGFGSYLIRSLGVAKSARTKLAKYSIALQCLVYEGITEDEEQSDE